MQTDLWCEKADWQGDRKAGGEWTVGGTHRHQGTFRGDEYVLYLEGDGGFMSIYMCQITDFKYVQFIVYYTLIKLFLS